MFPDELRGEYFLNRAILGASRKELMEKLPAILSFFELGDFINILAVILRDAFEIGI